MPLLAAAVSVVLFAGWGGVLALPSLDSLLEELVENRIERQVESKVLQALERALEGDVEGALGDVQRSLDRAVTPASGALHRFVEVTPKRADRFQPDIDPAGRAIERGVWLVLAPPEHVEHIQGLGFTVRELRRLEALDRILIRVDAPVNRELAEAALQLGQEAPGTAIDFNHVYRGLAAGGVTADDDGTIPPVERAAPKVAIGIVDSAIAVRHEALHRAAIEQRDFVSYDRPRPTAHGTAVASILVGDSAALQGVIRGARLKAASVFFEDDDGESTATTASLVRALDWLAGSGVPVINMSLAGPPNRVLKAAIDGVAARGIVVVAAVGNGGPSSEPLYPAACAPVVGITAVDSRNRVYLHANRGRHVMFAAPGVDIPIARGDGGYGSESGTSMAAPYAAAIIARALADPGATPAGVLSALKATAIDLGDAGFDETFGYGRIAARE